MCIIQNSLTDLCNHLNNKIFHAYKSKVKSHEKITSYKNVTPCGNSTSVVKIYISMINIGILHMKYLVLHMKYLVLPCMSTHAEMKL